MMMKVMKIHREMYHNDIIDNALQQAKKVIMTDYTDELINLLNQNLSESNNQSQHKVESVVSKIDWTKETDYEKIQTDVDCIIATDVIYKGSPYEDLGRLIKHVAMRESKEV